MVGNREKCALIKVNGGNLWICGKPGCNAADYADVQAWSGDHDSTNVHCSSCASLLVILPGTFCHYQLDEERHCIFQVRAESTNHTCASVEYNIM